jgi:hypothetical protein
LLLQEIEKVHDHFEATQTYLLITMTALSTDNSQPQNEDTTAAAAAVPIFMTEEASATSTNNDAATTTTATNPNTNENLVPSKEPQAIPQSSMKQSAMNGFAGLGCTLCLRVEKITCRTAFC